MFLQIAGQDVTDKSWAKNELEKRQNYLGNQTNDIKIKFCG